MDDLVLSAILLRRDSGEPPALQLYRALAEAIRSGRFRAGERLPGERVLCEELGVARVTLRHALTALENEGLLHSSDRSGWYVATDVLDEPSNELLSFTEMARTRGLTPTARVLLHTTRPAGLDEADKLRLAPGAILFELERLRLLNDVPVAVAYNLLAMALAPGLLDMDFSTASLFETLATDHGILPVSTEYAVQAEPANRRYAELLDLDEGAPVMTGTWRTFDTSGWPIEMGTVTYRGDRYRFQATLRRRTSSSADRTPNV